ncbi:hypothetical protein GYMLUDRAFT_61822 [Collybiopsis luxurians FD-317 M1]|uniref:Uncharacterized protein n=1 Tax=Collybiopsis luxurians FD-317 M1 TaxID=944289 RepID=A0A0D0CNE3_9AGAR|nr:hypothetical protein GYMLUDRAFT_61822 [Collybiopsis luxurians FD-317 M1]
MISDQELNIEAQKAALEQWNSIHHAKVHQSKHDIPPVEGAHMPKHHKSKNGSKKLKTHKVKHAHAISDIGSERDINEKLNDIAKPMSSHHSKQLKQVLEGCTPTPPSHRGDRLCTQLADQLPHDSILVQAL